MKLQVSSSGISRVKNSQYINPHHHWSRGFCHNLQWPFPNDRIFTLGPKKKNAHLFHPFLRKFFCRKFKLLENTCIFKLHEAGLTSWDTGSLSHPKYMWNSHCYAYSKNSVMQEISFTKLYKEYKNLWATESKASILCISHQLLNLAFTTAQLSPWLTTSHNQDREGPRLK